MLSPTFLPLKHTQKRRKSATLAVFLQKPRTAAATSSDLRSFLPKTVQFGNDRDKRVSAPRRGAGAKIAFLNEYVRDLVVCLIVPGKLLLPQISIVRFVGLLFSWRCSAIFLVATATRSCRYSCPVQRYSLKGHALQLQLRIVHVHACKDTTVRRSAIGLSSAL